MSRVTMHIDNKLIKTMRYDDLEEAQLAYEYFMMHAQDLTYVRYAIVED